MNDVQLGWLMMSLAIGGLSVLALFHDEFRRALRRAAANPGAYSPAYVASFRRSYYVLSGSGLVCFVALLLVGLVWVVA